MVCCLCVFVEYCADAEVIQPEGFHEGRKFATPHEAYASWFASIFQSHFTRLIPSSRLVERIGLVVVQDTQSLYEHMTTRTVSRIHYFGGEGHFLVPALRVYFESNARGFPISHLSSCVTPPTPILIVSLCLLILLILRFCIYTYTYPARINSRTRCTGYLVLLRH